MFEVKGEGLTNTEVDALRDICTKVCGLAHRAATESNAGKKMDWFGRMANSPAVEDGLKAMDAYLNSNAFASRSSARTPDRSSIKSWRKQAIMARCFQT